MVWGSLKIYSNSFPENVTDFYRLSNEVKINSTSPINFGETRQLLLDQMKSINIYYSSFILQFTIDIQLRTSNSFYI